MRIKKKAVTEWVFPSPVTGKALNNIKRSWKSLLVKAGIEGVRFHDLRHTAGTRLAQVVDLATVAEILGHSDIKTTKKYINPQLEQKREAIQRMAWSEVKRIINSQYPVHQGYYW